MNTKYKKHLNISLCNKYAPTFLHTGELKEDLYKPTNPTERVHCMNFLSSHRIFDLYDTSSVRKF